MTEALKMKYFKETEAAVKHLEAGGEIPGNLINTMRNDPRFKNLTVSTKADKDFVEIQEVVLGKLTKGKGEIIEGKAVEKGMGEKLLKGEVVDEKIELFAFMNELPAELQHKVALLPIEQQIPLLKKFKEAVDAVKTGGTQKGIEILQEQLLKDFIPKGQPHATGGLIDGYATGGVSNLFRQRYRGGKVVDYGIKLAEWITKHGPRMEKLWIQFRDGIAIKISNEIRQGIGKWKNLTQSQKIVQHDNFTKVVDDMIKNKKYNPKLDEYAGINVQKEFIEANTKLIGSKVEQIGKYSKSEVLIKMMENTLKGSKSSYIKKTFPNMIEGLKKYPERANDPKVWNFFIKGLPKNQRLVVHSDDSVDFWTQSKFGPHNIESTAAFQKKHPYLTSEQATKITRMEPEDQILEMKRLEIERAKNIAEKSLKDMEQEVQLFDFDVTGKKGNAEGGLISGYATGGVSNLFRSR